MAGVLLAVGIYLVVGALAILLLDIITGRIRRRIVGVSYDTQTVTGGGRWVALVVTILALWVFWPLAIYAAVFQRGGSDGA